ncbi:MAG: nucleoside 2-deoxyribosyltransferase [Alphaproteobacteria bacterium]
MYLAGPLFSNIELSFNKSLKRRLSQFFEVYLPQEDGELLVKLVERKVPTEAAKQRIYNNDIQAIHEADLLLIILDGRVVDEGAAFEIGFGKALGKPCFGLQTDPRRLLPIGNNPMIDCSLERIFLTERELLHWAPAYIANQHKIKRMRIDHAKLSRKKT